MVTVAGGRVSLKHQLRFRHLLYGEMRHWRGIKDWVTLGDSAVGEDIQEIGLTAEQETTQV